MKYKMSFEKHTRLETLERQTARLRLPRPADNWPLLRSLALAEPVKPCRRHFD
jgi:hypothetical protein